MKKHQRLPISYYSEKAWRKMKGNRGTCYTMSFLYQICFKSVVTACAILLYILYFNWMRDHSDLSYIIERIPETPVAWVIFCVVAGVPAWLIFSLAKAVMAPLYIGVRRASLKIADGKKISVPDLLDGFRKDAWHSISLTFMKKALLTILNGLLILGAGVAYIWLSKALEGKSIITCIMTVAIVAIVLIIASVFVGIEHIILSMTHLVMSEQPSTSARAAMYESAHLLRKHKMEFFRMHISFLNRFLYFVVLFSTTSIALCGGLRDYIGGFLFYAIALLPAIELTTFIIRPYYLVAQADFYRYLQSVAVADLPKSDGLS